jgi:hypothetical protein
MGLGPSHYAQTGVGRLEGYGRPEAREGTDAVGFLTWVGCPVDGCPECLGFPSFGLYVGFPSFGLYDEDAGWPKGFDRPDAGACRMSGSSRSFGRWEVSDVRRLTMIRPL